MLVSHETEAHVLTGNTGVVTYEDMQIDSIIQALNAGDNVSSLGSLTTNNDGSGVNVARLLLTSLL